MHVITIFTLIFLPGTFIAVSLLSMAAPSSPISQMTADLTSGSGHQQTFFSSGVLRWDEDGTLGYDWVVRSEGMRLFMAICLPMMVITIAAWAIMYRVARRWARRNGKEMGVPGYADEKAPSRP